MQHVNIPNLSLQQIQIFVKAVELRNYTKVSEYFYFSPSMISKTIARIEEMTGIELFVKESHILLPTPAAKIMAHELNSVLHTVEQCVERAHKTQNGEKSLISIGFIDASDRFDRCLREITGEFSALYPDVDLKIEKFDMHDLVEKLNEGLLDIILTSLHERVALDAYHLSWELLIETNQAVYVSRACKLFENDEIGFCDLRNEPFIILSPIDHVGYYTEFNSKCIASGFKPEIALMFTNIRSVLCNLQLGKGVFWGNAITSDWVDDNIKKFDLPSKTGTIISWGRHPNERAAQLVSFLREQDYSLFYC